VPNKNRPPIPSNTPPILKDMLERSWHHLPAQRPKFEQLSQDINWDKIITDAITHGQAEAENTWKNFGKKGESPQSVSWTDFVRGFSKFLEVPNANTPELEKTIEWKCLGAILEIEKTKQTVTHENFLRFLSWFGPVRTGAVEGLAFLKQIVTLLQQEWFHGNIGDKEAEKRLLSDPRSKNTALFLLRFSKKQSTYTMTYRKKPKSANEATQNERLPKENWTDIASLISYIEKERKKRHLQPCKNSRGYDLLFVKEIVNLYNVDTITTPLSPTKKS